MKRKENYYRVQVNGVNLEVIAGDKKEAVNKVKELNEEEVLYQQSMIAELNPTLNFMTRFYAERLNMESRELELAAKIGALKAIENYRSKKGDWISYASMFIRQEILNWLDIYFYSDETEKTGEL